MFLDFSNVRPIFSASVGVLKIQVDAAFVKINLPKTFPNFDVFET